jgi:hypothetical protein
MTRVTVTARPRHRRTSLVGVAALATAALTLQVTGTLAPAQAASSGVQVPGAFFGMHAARVDGTLDADQKAGLAKSSGIGSIELLSNGSEWSTVEPTQGVLNYAVFDSAIVNATAGGVKDINVVLTGTPQWAAAQAPRAGEPSPGYSSPPADKTKWSAYVDGIVKHCISIPACKANVKSFQVWSEANLPSRWNGTGDELASLTALAKLKIAAANAAGGTKFKVIAASTTLRLQGLGAGTFYSNYLKGLKARGWPVDAFAFHGYPKASGTPVNRQSLIAYYKNILKAAGAPTKPLWDGEVNYGVPGPGTDPYRALDNATGAGYVARTYLDSLRLGIARVYVSAWQLDDGPGYGVTFFPRTPGATALKTTYGWLAGKWYRGCTTSTTSVGKLVTCKVSVTMSPGSTSATIAYSEGGLRKVTVPANGKRKCTLLTGCTTAKPGSVVSVGQSPVWFGP